METGDAPAEVPRAADAARILAAVMGGAVAEIARFPTGLAHYVYDARLADGRRYVVRLTRPAWADAFAGALYWHARLTRVGVPLPGFLYADVAGDAHGFPVIIMERLPGVDLGDAYPALSSEAKRRIARQVVAAQRRAATLPAGPGFGYARAYDDPTLKASWQAVVDEHLERSRRRIRAAGLVDAGVVERVQAAVDARHDEFAAVEPICFLHDTTTKNVIVADGRLSGIVDVDSVCFGDPLYALALTRMACLSLGYDSVYVDAWANELALSPERPSLLTLYTAVFCVDFLSELGHAFNQDAPQPLEPGRVRHLLSTLDDLLAAVGSEI